MRVELDASVLKETSWQQYAVRFLLGGAITACTGLIAMKFGPVIGGLFLAFPAIFPASATLIEKHEKEKKQAAGLDGTHRGRSAASLDAIGSSMGAWGLVVFGLLFWQLEPGHSAPLVLLASTCAWLVLSVLIWFLYR